MDPTHDKPLRTEINLTFLFLRSSIRHSILFSPYTNFKIFMGWTSYLYVGSILCSFAPVY